MFLDLMKGDTKAADVANSVEPWKPGTKNESALFRTTLRLAAVLIHEFCHALW